VGLLDLRQTALLTEPLMLVPVILHIHKCFVFIPGFIGRFYNSGNECNSTNTEQLVFTKPCPQKGFMKTWNYVFQRFQFRLNLTGTKPQFAEIFRYYITEAEIIQNRGFRSTLKCTYIYVAYIYIKLYMYPPHLKLPCHLRIYVCIHVDTYICIYM